MNTTAKQKDTKTRKTFGFVIMWGVDNTYSNPVWCGMMDAAKELDVNVIGFTSKKGSELSVFDFNPGTLEQINANNLDGLVLILSELKAIRKLKGYGALPIVTIGMTNDEFPGLVTDNYDSMKKQINHLIEEHGRKKIAFMKGWDGHPDANARFQAYLDALTEHNLTYDPQLVLANDFLEIEPAEQEIDRFLEQHIEFDAIAASADKMAIGAMKSLEKHNLRVPYDVSIIGFDDLPESAFTTSPITTVRQPLKAMGRRAVELLLAQIRGEKVAAQEILPSILVRRQSCGCFSDDVLQGNSSSENKDSISRAEIIEEMTRHSNTLTLSWAERLFDGLMADVNNKTGQNFLVAVDEASRQLIAQSIPVATLNSELSILRRKARAIWAESLADLGQAEDLWQQARVFLGEATLRQQSQRQAKIETQNNILREFGEVLITTFDIKELMTLISNNLPKFGIHSFYLALYTEPDQVTEKARLILAQRDGQQIALSEAQQDIFTRDLLSTDLLPNNRYDLLTMPLHFRNNWLGYMVFDVLSRKGDIDGAMYEAFRSELSSALQGALLVLRVNEQTAETKRQQYILDTFMANVPDRIYFKDAQSRFTQTNQALANKTGARTPADLIGKSDFDFFPPDQAEVKFQQEQTIIKTGQPILNLEEPDGIDHWVLTTKMPLRDGTGTIIGTFGISSDITELVKAKKTAEAAVAEADKALKLAEIEKEKAQIAKQEAEKAHREVETANQTLAAQIWQTTGQALLNEKMRGEQELPTLANNIIQQLSKYTGADSGAIYTLNEKTLKLAATYAYRKKSLVQQYEVGEGWVGQAVVEKEISIKEIPDEYIAISLKQGKLLPKYNLVAPVIYNDQISGVITLESMKAFTTAQTGFLEKAIESVAIAFMTAQARARVNELFSQTRRQAEELQAQEEELRATNEELEAQTDSLRASETRLKANQTALEAANADLEEKTHILQEQQAALDQQNQVLRDAQLELERKADELVTTNKYKSEFLANMSHELRTPLNSLLILAGMLAKNEAGNLNKNQVESAQVIYASGADLLELINEILDLSKVEAGQMTFHFEQMPLASVAQNMRQLFEHVAQQKNVEFQASLAAGLPESITTDQQRVEQIVKNLLSNAFKFTEKGIVKLSIKPAGEMIAISVRDSGIGMTAEQQKRVFEAFQQADGSTSRKYGGTGLGLTISRELALKLNGRIGLESEPGKGSEFTLYLPLALSGEAIPPQPAPVSGTDTQLEGRSAPQLPATRRNTVTESPAAPSIPDDSQKIQKGDKVLLVIEDDANFAKVLYDYAQTKGFKCVVAGDGESGLKLAALHHPNAILLDLNLPNMNGWDVLDRLKADAGLRHIPIHILSAADQTMDAYKRGALGFLSKPISHSQLDDVFFTIGDFLARDIKSLLIVEDDSGLRFSVGQLLGGSDVKISEAARGEEALTLLRQEHFDCMILDLTLPDMSGFELLNKINEDKTVSKCPVIVYTGQALTEEENAELLKYARSVIIKGVKSPERLLDETALFLHRVVADMPEDKRDTIRLLHDRDAVFSGKHILVVDDNMRNAFALSSLLSDKNLQVSIARSGAKAIEMLETTPNIDLVLMDIMMPEMDGYETMRRVRAMPQFKNLPMLALTANAMKGDREKCIAAGANDYLSKPIDADRLFSMLRVWLYR